MSSSNFSWIIPQFCGENYYIWSIKMKTYLQSLNLWEVVETGNDPTPLGNNSTVAQRKEYEENLAKKPM